MKKIILVVVSVIFLLLVLSSCKTTHDCPAYGKAEVKTEVKA